MLRDLFLSYNGGLSGSLPASWGADGSSMALLQRVQITNCNLSGHMPASWATQILSLRVLDLSSNSLSGKRRDCLCMSPSRTYETKPQSRAMIVS